MGVKDSENHREISVKCRIRFKFKELFLFVNALTKILPDHSSMNFTTISENYLYPSSDLFQGEVDFHSIFKILDAR